MSTFTGYQCDKCGNEYRHEKTQNGYSYEHIPCCISFSVNLGETYPSQSGVKNQVWCRPCVIANGLDIHLQTPTKAHAPETRPTTEELLERIIREMGFIKQEDLS